LVGIAAVRGRPSHNFAVDILTSDYLTARADR
jgi:hypothetical protein